LKSTERRHLLPIETSLAAVAAQINDMLGRLLPEGDGAERRVLDAMRYATMGGGKRIGRSWW